MLTCFALMDANRCCSRGSLFWEPRWVSPPGSGSGGPILRTRAGVVSASISKELPPTNFNGIYNRHTAQGEPFFFVVVAQDTEDPKHQQGPSTEGWKGPPLKGFGPRNCPIRGPLRCLRVISLVPQPDALFNRFLGGRVPLLK